MSAEQWLTYQQAAEILGMSSEAVRQRARRLRWRTQRGNDGKALILVPSDEVPRLSGRPAVQPAVQTPVQPAEIEALSTLMNTLRDQLERSQKTAEAERQQHIVERDRLVAEAQATRTEHRAELETERTRHAADVAWHRAEIERTQKKLAELEARTWLQRLFRRG